MKLQPRIAYLYIIIVVVLASVKGKALQFRQDGLASTMQTPPITVKSCHPSFPVAGFGDLSWNAMFAATKNGTSVERTAPELLPYSIIIRNDSRFPVVGIAVQYVLHGNPVNVKKRTEEPEIGPIHFYHSFGLPSPVIPPGDVFLVTPVDALNSGPVEGLNLQELGRAAQAQRSQLNRAATSITIEVDSIWLADGRVIGPDVGQSLNRQQQDAKAWNDLLVELKSRTQRGQSEPTILDWLASEHKAKVIGHMRSNPYGLLRKLHAARIAQIYAAGGLDRLQPKAVHFHKDTL